MSKHLTNEEFFSVLETCDGLIPIEIDAHNEQIIWKDFETYHFYEGFFHKSINTFNTLKSIQNKTDTTFITSLNVLKNKIILKDSLYPTGFIFHAGRSGSTLLSKVLARSRRNLVLSEANPLNQFFLLNSDSKEKQILYKNLILAMGRKRVSTHTNYFIKFTSFNILFFDFIRSVFPDVPSLFIYREPMRTLSSFNKNPPGWLQMNETIISKITGISSSEVLQKNTLELEARILAKFFKSALNNDVLKYLNYNQMFSSNLSIILKAFNVEFSDDDLVNMKSQFNYDSKAEHNTKSFHLSETIEENEMSLDESIKTELFNLYENLNQSSLNIMSLDKGNNK